MPCACNGTAAASAPEPQYEVKLPSGQTKVVSGEHAAKVEVTMAGGGTYSKM